LSAEAHRAEAENDSVGELASSLTEQCRWSRPAHRFSPAQANALESYCFEAHRIARACGLANPFPSFPFLRAQAPFIRERGYELDKANLGSRKVGATVWGSVDRPSQTLACAGFMPKLEAAYWRLSAFALRASNLHV
jgi:hypothetical protein